MNIENLLNLKNPDEWTCEVVGLNDIHSLGIQLIHKDHVPMMVGFGSVLYISCPMWWIGANIERGPDEECIELTRSLPNHAELTDGYISGHFTLFIINSVIPKERICILAHSEFSTKQGLGW